MEKKKEITAGSRMKKRLLFLTLAVMVLLSCLSFAFAQEQGYDTFTFHNGSITVETAAESGEPLQGAVFTLYDGDVEIETYTSDAAGKITLRMNDYPLNLHVAEAGTENVLYLKQTGVPKGYSRNRDVHIIRITAEEEESWNEDHTKCMLTVDNQIRIDGEESCRVVCGILGEIRYVHDSITVSTEEGGGLPLMETMCTVYFEGEEIESYGGDFTSDFEITTEDPVLRPYLPKPGGVTLLTMKETLAPEGYILSDIISTIRITAEEEGGWNEDHSKYVSVITYDMTVDGKEETVFTSRYETWREKFAEHFRDTVQWTESSYRSPNIAVEISEHHNAEGEPTLSYYVADIYLADIECFRTFFTDNLGTTPILQMAEENNAILTVNGDFLTYVYGDGILIRNWEILNCDETYSDICVLYHNGTLETYSPGEYGVNEVMEEGVYQSWKFGPALLDREGHALTTFNTTSYIVETHPRTCLGYYEPGHYCFVVVDGRNESHSIGLNISETAQLMESLGCTRAYNLDGGGSSFMVFNGEYVNVPCESTRQLCDILYIAER